MSMPAACREISSHVVPGRLRLKIAHDDDHLGSHQHLLWTFTNFISRSSRTARRAFINKTRRTRSGPRQGAPPRLSSTSQRTSRRLLTIVSVPFPSHLPPPLFANAFSTVQADHVHALGRLRWNINQSSDDDHKDVSSELAVHDDAMHEDHSQVADNEHIILPSPNRSSPSGIRRGEH